MKGRAQPLIGDIRLTVDLIAVTRAAMTVRNRANGQQLTLPLDDGVSIGANEAGEGYTLVLRVASPGGAA